MANTLTPGTLTLSPTDHSIGVEATFTDDDNANATATLEFKESASGVWRTALPMHFVWAPTDSGPKACYGVAPLLELETAHDIRVTFVDADGITGGGSAVLTGSSTTRADNTTAASSLVVTHYVNAATGNDTTGTGAVGAPWKTLLKAIQIANASVSDMVVEFAAGHYDHAATALAPLLGRSITFKAANPAVQSVGGVRTPINQGSRSVIEWGASTLNTQTKKGSRPAGATDSDLSASTVWVPVEPGTAGNVVYKWTDSGISSANQLGYVAGTSGRSAEMQRIPHWKDSTPGTPAAFADAVYNSANDMPYGFWWDGADADTIYLRLPGNADPRDGYLLFGSNTVAGLTINGPGVRVTGFEVRHHGRGIYVTSAANAPTLDHNLLSGTLYGVRVDGNGTTSTVHNVLVEDNYFRDTNLWAEDGSGIPWLFIKSTGPGGLLANRTGEDSEGLAFYGRGGGRSSVFRRNTTRGVFNGIGGEPTGYDRYANYNLEAHHNTWEVIPDDVYEPDFQNILWKCWADTVDRAFVLFSTAPGRYGPHFLFGINATRLSSLGTDGKSGACYFKLSTAGSAPQCRVHVINCTLWTNPGTAPGTDAGIANSSASGAPTSEVWTIYNSIIRVDRYAWLHPTNTRAYLIEDGNVFATGTAGSHGVQYNGVVYTTQAHVASYRTAYNAQTGRTNPKTNLISGVDVAFTDEAAVDALLTDPTNGDVRLKDGANGLVASGIVVPGWMDTIYSSGDWKLYHYEGAAPDRGYRQRSYVDPEAGSSPAQPTSPSATADGDDTIDLAWTDAADNETSYVVERSLTGGAGTFAVIVSLAADVEAYSDTGLPGASTRYYRIGAANGAGTTYSATVSAPTDPSAAVPAQPTAPEALPISSSAIHTRWQDNASDETSYRVERSNNAASGWATRATLGVNASAYTDTGLNSAETWYYRVIAVNPVGDSTPSSAVFAKTLPPSPPSTGGRVTAARSTGVRTTAVRTTR